MIADRSRCRIFCGDVLRRRPLFSLALMVVAALAASAWQVWAGAALLLVGGAMVWLMVGWRFAIGVMVFGCWVLGWHLWTTHANDAARDGLCAMVDARVVGKVVEDPRGADDFWAAPVRLREPDEYRGVIVWWLGRGPMPVSGSQVTATGRFSEFEKPRNPGEFDRSEWLLRRGMVVAFEQDRRPAVVLTGRLAHGASRLREGFRSRLTAGLPPDDVAAKVIRAVVMGEKPTDGEDLIEAFRHSGTLHVFTVSGLHVAMVAAIGWWILSLLGLPRRWAVPVLLPWVFGYAWLTGANPPAVRAAWMAAVFLGAFVFRREPNLLNALGAVLLVSLCGSPGLLFQPGVQLSYGVVAAIAVGSPWMMKGLSWLAAAEPFLPRQQYSRWQSLGLSFRQWLARALSVSLSAGLGAAPLTAWHFGLLTPVSVVAGVVLVPLVFVLLLLALVSVALSPVAAPVSQWINQGNALLADGCVRVARGFAEVPAGHWRVGVDRDPMLLVHDLDHGDGAACLSAGDGAAVLFDCGGRRSFRYRVWPSLRGLGLAPDSVVLSHPDGGHLGGASQVWDHLPIRQVVVPVRQARSPDYRAWLKQAPAAGISVLQAEQLGRLPLPDGAQLEWLHLPDADAMQVPADDRVAVFRIHWRGWKMVFLGDAGIRTEEAMLASGVDLGADVLLAGKHRSSLCLSDRFIEAVSPRLVIVGNDSFPAEERIDPGLADYWRSRGLHWIDQSQSGGVVLRVADDGSLHARGHVDGRSVWLKP